MTPRCKDAPSRPATHTRAIEQVLDALEREATFSTLPQLHQAVAAIVPEDMRPRAVAQPVACRDRGERVRQLEERLRRGQELWHASDVVHLPPRCRRVGPGRQRKQVDELRGQS